VSRDDIAAALAPAGTGANGYNYPILTMLLPRRHVRVLEHWGGNRSTSRWTCSRAPLHTRRRGARQLAKLVQAADLHHHDLRALRVVTNSGAKLPSSVAESMERLFGCTIQSIYGTSEAGATAMTRVDDAVEKRRSTVGRPLDGQEVRILDSRATMSPPHGR